MRFTINLLSQHNADRSQAQLFQELLEQAQLADDLGFDGIVLNEHHPFHNPSELWLQPFPVLGGLATATSRITLGTNILILPLHHPVRIAEDVAMLHSMSGGRVILGVGIGYVEAEFAVFGVDRKRRTARFEEQIEIMRRLWTEEDVTFHGEHFQLDHVSLPVGALEPIPPPIWIGAEAKPAIERAGRLGDGWLPADTASIKVLREHYAIYEAALQASGRTLDSVDRPLMRESFCARTRVEAEDVWGPHVVEKYRQYWEMEAPQLREEFPEGDFTLADLSEERFIVGTPDDCIEQIRLYEEFQITDLIFRVQKKEISHENTMTSIRLFGEEVIPAFR